MECPARDVAACARVRGDRHRHVPLRFVPFRAARPFGGSGIEHRRGQRVASQVRPQDLVTVNVPAEYRRETRRNRTAGNDIGSMAEHISGGTDCRPLHRLVEREQPQIGGRRPPSRPFEETTKALADLVPLVRETGDRHGRSASIQQERTRPVEDVDSRVSGQERIRDRRALVVAGNDDDRHPGVGEPLERLERAQHEARLHLASKEDITTVNDEIDLSAKRRLQRAFEPGEETRQTEVRVREEEETEGAASHTSNVQLEAAPARSL